MGKKLLAILLVLFFVTACSPNDGTNESVANNKADYDLYAEVYDDGQKINKVIINMPFSVEESELQLDTFSVETNNKVKEESGVNLDVENGERQIKDVYLEGREKEGTKVILELRSKFGLPYTETLVWNDDSFSNIPLEINYIIKQNKPLKGEIISDFKQNKIVDISLDKFEDGQSSNGIKYRAFKPKDKTKQRPLIIWFHGAGEGGDNNIAHISANKGAVAFVTEEAQSIFEEPHVLAPQSPDFWMPKFEVGSLVLEGKSRTKELIELIEEYIIENDVDKNRVYVGGASMGGYQTWEVLAAKPDLFTAAFPISTAYQIPLEILEKLTDKPIWITHAIEDEVAPYEYSKNAFEYLNSRNNEVVFTTYTNVRLGNDEYDPHSSWVYALNNKPEINEVNLFEWLYSKTK